MTSTLHESKNVTAFIQCGHHHVKPHNASQLSFKTLLDMANKQIISEFMQCNSTVFVVRPTWKQSIFVFNELNCKRRRYSEIVQKTYEKFV
jgi:hypothetical protein